MSTWNVASTTEELNFKFYIILMNLKSHIELSVAMKWGSLAVRMWKDFHNDKKVKLDGL